MLRNYYFNILENNKINRKYSKLTKNIIILKFYFNKIKF